MGRAIVAGGKPAMEAPGAGLLASNLAVGSTVKLLENGTAVEYLVVNQGVPSNSSLYDSSCNGTWLLLKNRVDAVDHVWNSTWNNDYKNSEIHNFLNSEYLSRFDSETQSVIKQVKIPFVNGDATGSVASGSNGLSTKLFLLSRMEVGGQVSSNYKFEDGAKLAYFLSGSDREANGIRKWGNFWWLRSVVSSGTSDAGVISATGAITTGAGETSNSYGVRPCLVVPSNAVFDSETLILTGVM